MPRYEAVFTIKGSTVFKPTHFSCFENVLKGDLTKALKVDGDRVFFYCDASDKDAALKSAMETTKRFCRLLSVFTGEYFSPEFKGLDNIAGQPGDSILAGLLLTSRVVTYDVEQLPQDIETSGSACTIQDKRLDKACAYFHHGLWLRNEAWRFIDPTSFDWTLLVSEAILNFYKAVALVLGHPIHMPAAEPLELDRTTRKRVEKIYELRDKRDIAHPDLGWEGTEERVADAEAVAQAVLTRYVNALRSGWSVPAPPVKRGRSGRRRK